MAFPPIEPKTYDMIRRVGTLSFSRLPFAEREGFSILFHIPPSGDTFIVDSKKR